MHPTPHRSPADERPQAAAQATGERALAEMLQAIQGLDVERGLRFASGRLDNYVRRQRK